MPRENSSGSSGIGMAAVVTVAALGLGALAGFLVADNISNTNTNYQERPRAGFQLRELPAPSWADSDGSDDERRKRRTNTNHQQRPNVGHQLCAQPASSWEDSDDSNDERKNHRTKKTEECVLCLTDIQRYSDQTMMCGHRIHEKCWKRMKECHMTCPTCSDSVFSA